MGIGWAAPGRINLIGDHTDYNLGFSLPIAIPQRAVVDFEPDGTDRITVTSQGSESAFGLDTQPGDVTDWSAYVAGIAWALREAGHPVPGGRMSISSDVPVGAGLSSSAAIECSVMGALLAGAGSDVDLMEQARLAQRAENAYVGAPTGLLDQIASLFGQRGRALRIDFQDTSVEPVAFDPEADGVRLLCWDSRAPHSHAGGEYASRRAACEQAAADLGATSLRDVQEHPLSVLDGVRDETARKRARHVLTENQRVFDLVDAVAARDFATAGALFTASHVSMRDDFENSVPAVDLIVETAVRAGAHGARMTGGGFGGCVIALAPAPIADAISDAVIHESVSAGHPAPTAVDVAPSPGAGPVA